jgi:dihydrofolate reductase
MRRNSVRKLSVFNSVSLDGYFTDSRGDMSWAHKQDKEWNDFVNDNASGGGELVFGRVTYDMMNSFWPTSAAAEQFPVVAKQMNELPKVVFSRSMKDATWNNTRLFKDDLVKSIEKLKDEKGDGMVIMGSGTIIAQLALHGLIDEYQVVVVPVILGSGKTMFEGLEDKLNLKLTRSRTFKNGNVFSCYEPA